MFFISEEIMPIPATIEEEPSFTDTQYNSIGLEMKQLLPNTTKLKLLATGTDMFFA